MGRVSGLVSRLRWESLYVMRNRIRKAHICVDGADDG